MKKVEVNILLFQVGENDHLPCEIAALEFSLYDGITKIFHSFVNPHQWIPLGYAYAIQQNANGRHNLDPKREPLMEEMACSHETIIGYFKDFIGSTDSGRGGGGVPVLYSSKEDSDSVENMLEKLYTWGRCDIPQQLRVYHVDELYAAIGQELKLEPFEMPVHQQNVAIATNRLNSGEFDFSFGKYVLLRYWTTYRIYSNIRPGIVSASRTFLVFLLLNKFTK